MRNIFIKPLIAVLAILCSLFSQAQVTLNSDTIDIQKSENDKVNFARFKPNGNMKMQNGPMFLKNILKAKTDDELRLSKETIDELGFTHHRYQHYYKGINVQGSEYLMHGKNGLIEVINGNFEEVNLSSVIPALTEQQALNSALKFVGAKMYKWQDAGSENFIKQNSGDLKATYFPKGEIVITRDHLQGGKNLKLSWKFSISSLTPNNEQLVYVDANSGKVINNVSLIYDVNIACTAQTLYSNRQPITGDTYTGGIRLREVRNGVNIQTLNLNGSYNYGNATDFSNNNTNWTPGSWPNIGQDQQALDAHWGAERVFDYWSVVHNRNSIDGNGLRVLSYIHYSPTGYGWSNAQWVSGTNNRFMQYGDGNGSTIRPLTSLDICAHEFGHGISEFTAGLTPGTQESGALNEGFSDIWGACVEFRSAPAKQTWLLGEDILATTGFNCIRNLQNPKSTTALEGQHPDTYQGQFWSSAGEPHNNSTVLSHWFFLLSQGGSGTNDLNNTFNVTGIGINNAERIAYRTELRYLTSSANYAAARNGSIQAARDLFGANSCAEIAVTNAWYAVGVGTPYNVTPVISGYSGICGTNPSIYTLANIANINSVAWSVSPSGIVNLTTSGNTCTLTKTGTGVVTLTAVVNTACSPNASTIIKRINIGLPQTNYKLNTIQTLTSLCGWDVILQDLCNATGYIWNNYDPLPTIPVNNYLVEQNVDNGPFTLTYQIAAVNECGTGNFITKSKYVPAPWRTTNCDLPARPMPPSKNTKPAVFPNPSASSITVTKKDNTGFNRINVFDMMGNLKMKLAYPDKTKKAVINISSLPKGVYQIQLSDGEKRKVIPFSKL